MPNEKTHLGSFTNIPGLGGQIDPDTGKKWVYAPKVTKSVGVLAIKPPMILDGWHVSINKVSCLSI